MWGVNFLYSSNHLSDHHPVFFSLMQWNCCDIHVKEFDEFLSVPPFTTGWHNADTVWTLNNPNFHPGIWNCFGGFCWKSWTFFFLIWLTWFLKVALLYQIWTNMELSSKSSIILAMSLEDLIVLWKRQVQTRNRFLSANSKSFHSFAHSST